MNSQLSIQIKLYQFLLTLLMDKKWSCRGNADYECDIIFCSCTYLQQGLGCLIRFWILQLLKCMICQLWMFLLITNNACLPSLMCSDQHFSLKKRARGSLLHFVCCISASIKFLPSDSSAYKLHLHMLYFNLTKIPSTLKAPHVI